MSNRQRFYLALSIAFIIISFHQIATDLYLYWTYKWIDIPMHIMGGIMTGLFTFVLLRAAGWSESKLYLFIGVLLVGVAWELLEVHFRVSPLDAPYWFDTRKDLIDDIIGGLISIYIWKKIPN